MQKVICVIPGDGVGEEVTREALKVLHVVNEAFHLGLTVEVLDYGAERYLRDGTTLPAGEAERLKHHAAAIFLGALGDARVPNNLHARDILLGLRTQLDLYVNLRPVACLGDSLCPLKGKRAQDIDLVVLRENTEGLYAGLGGQFKRGTADEIAIEEDLNTRKGVERLIRAGFELAQKRPALRVTLGHKANAMRFAGDLWLRTFAQVQQDFPQVHAESMYVDALAMEMVRTPERFDVIVTNNLFGDILSDLGAALQGGLGMAPSANLRPQGVCLFEPVHGSAPDLVGKQLANPVAAIATVEMMLEHLGLLQAAAAIGEAIRAAVQHGKLTPDVGGSLGTRAVGDFIAGLIR